MEDPRSPEQIKEEEELAKRLKQIYKMAKANAAKKKKARVSGGGVEEAEEEVSVGHASSSQANSAQKAPLSARSAGSNASPAAKEYKPSKGNETIKEAENEDEDGDQDDADDHFGSDDEEEVSRTVFSSASHRLLSLRPACLSACLSVCFRSTPRTRRCELLSTTSPQCRMWRASWRMSSPSPRCKRPSFASSISSSLKI